jgi:transcriptional regulator with XRE-family HTH domain
MIVNNCQYGNSKLPQSKYLSGNLLLPMQTFGEWIKMILQEEKITQKELADRIGMTPAQISRIISGDRGTELHVIEKIARVIHRPPEEVYKRAAGLLPPKSKTDETEERAQYIIGTYRHPETKQRALEFLEYLLVQEERGEYRVTSTKKAAATKQG